MCEGITLYYSVMEVYETKDDDRFLKKFGWKEIAIEHVLGKYACMVGDGVYREEAIERCHDHAPFLLAQFGKEQAFKWKSTGFYDWVKREHRDIAKKVKDAAQGIRPARSPSPQAKDNGSPETLSGNIQSPSAALPVRGRGRPRSAKSSSGESSAADVDTKNVSRLSAGPSSHEPAPATQPAARPSQSTAGGALNPVEALVALLVEIARESGVKATARSVCNKIYFKCQFKNYGASKDVVSYYAKPLLAQLPEVWHGSPLQLWLQEEAGKPYLPSDKITVAEMPYQLQRRNQKQVSTRIPADLMPRKQPKPQMRREEGLAGEDAMDTEPDSQFAPNARHPRPAGKGAGLRLLSSKGKKRFTTDLDDGEESQGSRRGPKSAKTTHSADEDIDDEAENTNSELHSDEEEHSGPPKENVRLVITSERIPTMSPAGPNGSWVCGEPDCGYLVGAAREEDGKKLIQDHFRQHERQAQKLNLAMSEGMRGHMPIK
jgi:hypothetical protein